MRTFTIALTLLFGACSGPAAAPPPDSGPNAPDASSFVHDPGLEGPPFRLDDSKCTALADRIVCTDVLFSTVDGTELLLDLFAPLAARSQRVPAIMYVHGGGWLAGSHAAAGLDIDTFIAAGDVVLSIDYRLTAMHGDPQMPTGIVFPQNLQDVKTAVRWLRTKAGDFVDPDRILAYGFSAGAHLVSLLGTTASVAAFEGRGDPTIPSSVRAVVGLSTPIDFHLFVPQNPPLADTCPPQPPPGPGGTPSIGISLLIGGDFADPANSAKLDEVSALTYIDASSAPMKLFAGTCDQVVPYTGAKALVDLGTARGAQVSEHVTDGAFHGGTLSTPDAKQELGTFIAAQLAP